MLRPLDVDALDRVLDAIAERWAPSGWRSRFQGEAAEAVVETERGREKVLLLKPQTYYNEAGRAIGEAARFYKIPSPMVTVFHDELDLAPGKFRLKIGGGHAGNNGLRSTLAHLDGDFKRGRIGIGHPGDKAKVTGWVLSDFPKAETWIDDLADADALPESTSVAFIIEIHRRFYAAMPEELRHVEREGRRVEIILSRTPQPNSPHPSGSSPFIVIFVAIADMPRLSRIAIVFLKSRRKDFGIGLRSTHLSRGGHG